MTIQKKLAREMKEEKLKQAVSTLNKKRGNNYTPMQYPIWSEVYASGMHIDFDDPPNN